MMLKNVDFNAIAMMIVLAKDYAPSGVSSFFIRINDKIGIKFYCWEDNRDHCYKNQSELSKHELAPNVYGKLPPVHVGRSVYYGYLTEIVTVLKKVRMDKEDMIIESLYQKMERGELGYEEYKAKYYKVMYKKEVARKKLIRKMHKLGYVFYDTHDGNIGVKNGQYVCIDPELGYTTSYHERNPS